MTSKCVPQQSSAQAVQDRGGKTSISATRRQVICLALLISLSALLNGIVAAKMSKTTDESQHLRYGIHILQGQPDRHYKGYFDSQMPISALNAVPGALASYLAEHNLFPRLSAMLSGLGAERFPTILATLALNLLVYFWAFDLYGAEAALAACFLSVISPSLIAHGTLVTTDMYHALGVVAALYFFRRFLLQPSTAHAIMSSLVLALAQITKPFALSLYAVVGVVLTLLIFRRSTRASLTPKRVIVFAAIACASFLAIINVAYCFDRTFMPISSYAFESTSFLRLERSHHLRSVPVPFPYPFLQGLDMASHDEQIGRTFGNVYLLGNLRYADDQTFHGFKSYYAVAIFFKEPIALLLLFLCGLVWIFNNRTLLDFLSGEGLLLAAAAILFVWLSFFNRAQIGIRHILPVLAVETIIAGAAFTHFSLKPRVHKLLLATLVLWMAVSVGSYFPNMIPYMNEWVHDRRFSYRILADSNLDWGQDTAVVDEFMRRNPDVILDPPAPKAGRILVRANRLTDVDRWNPSLSYLSQHYQPVAQVGYAHFLFVVPAADLNSGKP
jgi:4-amino-4-deoxy-L-arabinose transferase-like glycosyltransferase